MKRVLWIFAAVFISAAVLFALLVALLPREVLKTRVGEQIAAWTGRPVSLRGEPEIAIFPQLAVTLNDVQVGGPPGMPDAGIVSMDRLTGTIRLLPLIIGRVEIGSFTMVRPLIRLVREKDGARNWEFDSGAAALQLAFAGDVPLGDFLLEDGVVIYEDRGAGESERLDSVNLSVNWSSVRQPLAVEGSGIWRGEQVTFSGSAETPFVFMSGGATPVDARLELAPVTMIFSGDADEYPTSRLIGALKMSTPSLRGFAAWLGSPIGPGSTLGPASIFGAASFSGGILSVENAELTLDGNSASGALAVEATARPDVTGTIAFSSLDLTPYFVGLGAALGTADDWREVALDTDWFRDFDADIRLSAASVELGELHSGDTAASISLREGRMEIGLARAMINGGSLSGDLTVFDFPNRPAANFEAQFRAADLDLAQAASVLGLGGFSGTAFADFDLAAGGERLGDLARNLGGKARLDVRDGAVPLFGIAEVAIAGVPEPQRPTEGLAATAVDNLSAGFSFSGGVGVLEFANIAFASYSADAKGWIGLLDGSLGLNGTIRTSAVDAETEGRPFTIEGTVRRPVARSLALAN